MGSMFYGCSSLKELNISNFNTLFKKRVYEQTDNKEEKEKQKPEYIFSYKDYILIYKRLIRLDVIKKYKID